MTSMLLLIPAGCNNGRTEPASSEAETEGDAETGEPSDPEDDDDGETGGDSDDEPVPDYVELDPAYRLLRISTALRGRRPSMAEMDRVEADPDALAEIVDGYLESDEFRETLRDLHNDSLFQDVEIFELDAVGPLENESPGAIAESVLQSPLRLIEDVVMSGRPYTEIVTADYWMVDQRSSGVWGTEYDPSGPTWQRASYPDDRPAAGILADNGFYMRHDSCGFNYNRGRANQVTTALLCHDFLAADVNVSGSVDLADPEAVATAAQTVPACVSCHQSLDPLASVFNPFLETFIPDPPYEYPLDPMYVDEFADYYDELTGRAPGYYGQPVDDVRELGQAIADDPRFSLCTATRFYGYLAQVPLAQVPVETASQLQMVLEDSDFDAKALIREIVLSEAFARASANDEADAELLPGYKRARPFQLANLYAQLTGWEWVIDTGQFEEEGGQLLSMPRTSFIGYEVLAGGHDSFFNTTPTRSANVTTILFLQKMARESASFVVEQDFEQPAEDRRLLNLVEPGDTDSDAVRTQLVQIFRRFYGETVTPDDDAIADAAAIFEGVIERGGNARVAWKTTLSALLQDPHILYY